MSEDQFTKLFNHINKRFDEQDLLQFAEVHARLDKVYNALDGMTDALKEAEVERAALTASDDRQKNWIKQLAGSTNIELVPEP